MRIDHNDQWDLTRGTTAIVVMLIHTVFVFGRFVCPQIQTVFLIADLVGRLAVLIFFVLSGYFITNSLCSNITRNGKFDFSQFLVARTARIYPPLIGAVAITIGACFMASFSSELSWKDDFAGGLHATPADVIASLSLNYGLLRPNGPLWTLYIECRLYIAAMCFAACVSSSWFYKIVWLYAGLLLIAASQVTDEKFLFLSAVWFVGAAIALVHRAKGAEWDRLIRYGGLLCGVCAVTLLIYFPATREIALTHKGAAFQMLASLSFSSLIFAGRWTYVPRILTATSKFSYSLYVVHYPILLAILALSYNWSTATPIRAFVTGALAALATILVAIPFAQLLENPERFKRQMAGQRE